MRLRVAALLALIMVATTVHAIDAFEDSKAWHVVVSDDVMGKVSTVGMQGAPNAPAEPAAATGQALRLQFDFNGKAGWAMAQRPLPLELPANFEITLRIRGDAKPNDLQFKLTDASGENVWWFRKPDYVVPGEWETLRIRKQDIEFAWGPTTNRELRRTAMLEIGFAAGHGGGAGFLEISSFELRELPVQAPEARMPTPNEVLGDLARRSPRGQFPRAFIGEQNYWTIVGVDGGAEEGMLSEDGAFELRKAAPSLEPFLTVDDVAYDWSNVKPSQSLRDRYLPMPLVRWEMPGGALETEAFGAGERGADYAVVRYEYKNATQREQAVTLAIAVRPMQVNPPMQFLNGVGGVAPIRELRWDGHALSINDTHRVIPVPGMHVTGAPVAVAAPSGEPASAASAAAGGEAFFTARNFEAAPTPQALLENAAPAEHLTDDSGFASGAFVYHRKVPAGASIVVAMLVPWSIDAAKLPQTGDGVEWLTDVRRRTAAFWHDSLDRVTLTGPEPLQPVFDTLRTALSHILINRDGPGLQPGSRSYERSWIRDGALSSASLLRLGHAPIAREFLDWYSQFLFSNGKVPCCVDFRGADPVPENDSPGEFLWLASELHRYTGDRAALERVWPRVEASMRYLEKLRLQERTPAQRGTPYYGLLPASISHEGYSAKPMHSYWDDFWGLAGYDSAVRMARDLGKRDLLKSWSASQRQFRADVHASIEAAMKNHRIDFIPGCAELGDFDATSTTIALSPVGEGERLPQRELRNTFERYWQDFSARREDWRAGAAVRSLEARAGSPGAAPPGAASAQASKWPVYTPYEIRAIGSFLRLGWRERADELLEFFMADRRPAGWNQWAEVVGRDAREPRFIGDMPHGWVASDFIRSILDMFAYEREQDGALILAAGIDPRWLEGEGIAVEGLQTPWGALGYSLRRDDHGNAQLSISGDLAPPGGFVLALGGVEKRFQRAPVRSTFEIPHAP